MIDHVEAPEIYVYSPDRRKNYGVLRNLEEFTEDVRFNTCSEVQLKVANKICDPLTGEWIENPVYENLEKNNLLFLCDDNEYFSFPNRTLRTDYGARTYGWLPVNYGRRTDNGYVSMTYENTKDTGNNDGVLIGFALQPETHLYNVSVNSGYYWQNLSTINEFGVNKQSSWSTNFYKVACTDFVPIQPYDVISVRNRTYKGVTGADDKFLKFTFFFYTEPDPNSYIGDLTVVYGDPVDVNKATIVNPVARFSINSIKLTDGFETTNVHPTEEELVDFKKQLANGGYFRVCVEDNRSTSSSATIATKRKFPSFYYTNNNTTVMGWSFVYNGWLQVYSGRRFCKQIDNAVTEGNYSIPLKWFTITEVEEDVDGKLKYKTITAYSYEYTLCKKTISLSEDTMPFYIPDKILDAVNSDNWIIDKEYGGYNFDARLGKQYMTEGLLNQVLKALPDWSVGHISSELMTRYRQIDNVDNSNIYSFLMNDVESLYQCYFVFDCNNKTISAYTQEDIVENSNIILNWQNALTSLKIKDQDKNFVTALRVHTSDDTYGVGLVNPTGNAFIYNFNSVLDKMDFVADSSDNDPLQRNIITENGITRNRTLKEAVESLMSFINTPNFSKSVPICTVIGDGDNVSPDDDSDVQHENVYQNKIINISSLSQYRNVAKDLVECNLDIIEIESSLSSFIGDYNSVLNKISVQAGAVDRTSYFNTEAIRTPQDLYGTRINSGSLNPFVSDDLYNELRNVAKSYCQLKKEYEAKKNDYNSYLDILKSASSKTNLNYYKQVALVTQYKKNNNAGLDEEGNPIILSLLTPAEILALQPFICEGDWTNDNSVFSEDYDAKDIINTLVSTFDQAKSDMDTFLSKPSYDFESSMFSWISVPEMAQNYKKLKVGKTLYINSIDDEYVIPMLLELRINYFDKDDFSMTFTTNYKRKVTELRFYDLYSEVNRISATDSTFAFNE